MRVKATPRDLFTRDRCAGACDRRILPALVTSTVMLRLPKRRRSRLRKLQK